MGAEKERCWKNDKPEMGNGCMKLNEDECIAEEKCKWYADKEWCLNSDMPEMGNKCMKLNEDECIAEEKGKWNADKEKCCKNKPEIGNKCMKLNEDECIADPKCTWNADKEKCWKNVKTKKKCEEKESEAEFLKEKKSRLRRKCVWGRGEEECKNK